MIIQMIQMDLIPVLKQLFMGWTMFDLSLGGELYL